MTELTKESITELLRTSDKAVGRALLVLNANQTEDEKASGVTKHHNGRGFAPYHAEIGTSMANYFQRNGFLTAGQLAFWRGSTGRGAMRIAMYHRQLIEAAKAKQASVDTSFNFGNNNGGN